jgi:hypothetical protein
VAADEATSTTAHARRLACGLPVTERVLGRLPGRRWVWILAWTALLPLVLLGVVAQPDLAAAWSNALAGDWSESASRLRAGLMRIGPAILAAIYAIPHALWAVAQMVRRGEEAAPSVEAVQLAVPRKVNITEGMGSVLGPAALAVGLGLLAGVLIASTRGAAHLGLVPIFVLVLLPQMTLVWVYLCLMVGLSRLGSHPLALEQYSGDRSLGLRPVGRLAFAGFWAFVANFAPLWLLAFGGWSWLDLLVASAFLLVGTFAIFGSLLRLHGQMAAAKRQQVARARQLYAEAFEPLRTQATLAVLGRQAPLLTAAEALEKRVEGIHTWPFSDALLVRAVVIASSVLVAVVTRFVQRSLGL